MLARIHFVAAVGLVVGVSIAGRGGLRAGEADSPSAAVVSHVKVLSDKVRDVSSMEAWKGSFIKDGATDREKALAIFRSVVMFRYQDPPPIEFLHEGCVHDAIKTFNVYGYGMCCCASSNVEALARYVGLDARGWAISLHSVPEVFYDGAWHMFDTSLVNYFPKNDGQVASVAEIVAAVKAWYEKHPEYRKNDAKLRAFHQSGGWMGWKQGPELLAKCPFYDWSGWWPAKTHGWYATMQEYDGTGGTPFVYEFGYSQGYQVNIQLRPGERLVRNWFHKGLHVNGILKDGDAPGCLHQKVGQDSMAYLTQYGDLTAERVGSGTLEYDVPLADASLRRSVLAIDNLTWGTLETRPASLHVQDASRPGTLELRMPTSYVYLDGQLTIDAAVAAGGSVKILFSDNNGLDWREVRTLDRSGRHQIDLQKLVLRRYDYRLRFVLRGGGAGLNRLRLSHAIQCSQRALPTLAQGDNAIRFAVGPPEGTITVEGASYGNAKGKNVSLADFHPVLKNIAAEHLRVQGKGAEAVFPIATPGDMTRLRLGGHFRARDKADRWDVAVSFDDGKTFRSVDAYVGPTQGKCRYVTVANVPPGTRKALVRWRGEQRNTTCLFSLRIDADYREPHGGFRPVKVAYLWDENGVEKKDVRVARTPRESYTIRCDAKPRMKSISLELEQ